MTTILNDQTGHITRTTEEAENGLNFNNEFKFVSKYINKETDELEESFMDIIEVLEEYENDINEDEKEELILKSYIIERIIKSRLDEVRTPIKFL